MMKISKKNTKLALREIFITVLLALAIFVAIRSVAQTTVISGSSMEPSLHDGQRVVVSKAAYWFNGPQRGDIVIFDNSDHPEDIIHRVVGLPGETVRVRKGILYVNGEEITEPYLNGSNVSTPTLTVPEDAYFIIGDNRKATSWDIVSRGDIIGKAWLSYWPHDEWGGAPNYAW